MREIKEIFTYTVCEVSERLIKARLIDHTALQLQRFPGFVT